MIEDQVVQGVHQIVRVYNGTRTRYVQCRRTCMPTCAPCIRGDDDTLLLEASRFTSQVPGLGSDNKNAKTFGDLLNVCRLNSIARIYRT